jgi:flagellar biosynthetic protein FliR
MDEFLSLLETVLRTFEIGQSPQAFMVLVGLAFARLLSFMVVAPFFGGTAVSARVKVAAAAAFVIIVYPSLATSLPPGGRALPFSALGFVALLAKEALVGFTLGFVTSLVFEGIQVAGRIIDFQRGAMLGEVFAPQLQTQVSALGQFNLQFAIVLFFAIGAHRVFIGALLHSFELIPAIRFPHLTAGWTPVAASITALSAGVLAIGVQLAAPAMIALLLTDIFFGLINRAAPQINVFFLGLPVKMLVGVLVILVSLQLLKDQYIHYFDETFKMFQYLLRTFTQAY